jgi:hypothetical protein
MSLTTVDAGLLGTNAQYTGFKNRVINGACVIDQRNAGAAITVTNASTVYPVDRMAFIAGGSSFTAQRVAGTGAYNYDVLLTGAASNTATNIIHRIESVNVLDLKNQNITIQVQLSSTTSTSVSANLYYANTADTFSGLTSIGSTTFTITSTPTIYTWTINAGASAANGLQIQLNFGALTSGTARFSGLQLEKGSTATSFDYRPYGTELNLCQRYFWIQTASPTSYAHYGCGVYTGTTNADFTVQYPQTMRTTPTLTFSAANTFWCDGYVSLTPSAMGYAFGTPQTMRIQATVSGATAGQAIILGSGGSGTGVISYSAEL